MKNILFFAYEFPPVQTTGSIRPLKFVKYLVDYGYRPIVITTDTESGFRTFKTAKLDEVLLKEISDEIVIIRIPTNKFESYYSNKLKSIFHHYFSISDYLRHHWGKPVKERIDEIIKEYNPTLIYATAPPFGVATIACDVSASTKLPLVMDMRDHWSLWGTSAYISWFHYFFTKKEEHRVFKRAKTIISVTRQVIDDFKKSHQSIKAKKFKVIPNGFELNSIDLSPLKIDRIQDKIIIGYMGEFYYSPEAHDTIFKDWYKKRINRMFQYIPRKENYKYRSPFYFFKTLYNLFSKYPQYKEIVEFHYIGTKKEWLDQMILGFGLVSNVVQYGKVSYTESLLIAKKFDFCLVTSIKVENGYDYALASKTFDYIGLRKPILGFVCDGAQKDFLENSGVAYIFNPDHIESTTIKLKDTLNKSFDLKYNVKYLQQFDRKRTTKQLVEIFERLINYSN